METIDKQDFPLNNDSYELWLVRYAEGELTDAEREAVEQWLEQHPEASEELKLYCEAPRLERDESVVYAATMSQHRPTVRPLWPSVLRWSAAAAVVAALVVPAVRWLTPKEQPVVVAQAEPANGKWKVESEERKTEPLLAEAVVEVESGERKVKSEEREAELIQPETEPLLADAVVEEESGEWKVDSEEREVESGEWKVESEDWEAEQPLVYVDNLFVVDSGDAIEQRLLAANETVKERLQGTYLGRRLARRLPSDTELLDYTDNLRERSPHGVRMVTDILLAFNDTNK